MMMDKEESLVSQYFLDLFAQHCYSGASTHTLVRLVDPAAHVVPGTYLGPQIHVIQAKRRRAQKSLVLGLLR